MADSGVANSPAITTIQNDFIDQMLGGSAKTNEAVAGVVAGLYFLFLLLSLFNFIRDKKRLHFLLMLFCASKPLSSTPAKAHLEPDVPFDMIHADSVTYFETHFRAA